MGGQTKIHSLKVGYVAGTSSISGATADSILAAANHALRGADSPGDPPADAALQRDRAVRVISGPSVINSAATRLLVVKLDRDPPRTIRLWRGENAAMAKCAPDLGAA